MSDVIPSAAPQMSEPPAPAPQESAEAPITTIRSRLSPWLTPLAYRLGCWFVLPNYFRIEITGQENLPHEGPVILAPTHRSRWDALLVPYAAGRFVTGRDIRFMVTADEVKGLQGWMIQRLGGFPVNPRQPAIASLRFGVEVLHNREMLVIFPEGGIFRDRQVHPLKPGLARLALQAESSQPGLGVKIVPIHLEYGQEIPTWGCPAKIAIGKPIEVNQYQQGSVKQRAQKLTDDLEYSLRYLGGEIAEDSTDCVSVPAS
ncbi:lysophospholipid acyltransferase family protein [Leptolyngbya ohadii]|uniref:lysophospholipid acyltransferase family protein n=1 Tax=Leptolyngbya ohadii TaxID=1962290 RepID=UPI0021F12D8C|nr:lysophospholipid acyltransferase family protein [Leptolyngbya ohadii]